WFLAYPDQRRFISYGVYVLVGFVGALLLTINGVVHKGFGWFAIALIGIGVLLANARTIFVELVILLGVILLLKASVQRRAPISRFKMLAWAASGAAFVLIVVSQMEAGSAFVARASEELVSGTVEYGDDPNAQFRLVAWAAALGRFTASPIVGEGFGVPFIFEHSDRDVRPHNTYLTVLYKTGLVGFLPLLLLLLYFYWNGWKALRRCNDQRSIFLYVLLLGHSALCLFGLLNLLLESPFLASMFWILMGVGIRTVLLLRKGSTEALQFTHV
ncbi:MAG: O-antigen ligase family protein, partial [Verrucomicrobiales bacterium]|nr:O-antigen ligase family protein [Verrucomicrobiales bacterium]